MTIPVMPEKPPNPTRCEWIGNHAGGSTGGARDAGNPTSSLAHALSSPVGIERYFPVKAPTVAQTTP